MQTNMKTLFKVFFLSFTMGLGSGLQAISPAIVNTFSALSGIVPAGMVYKILGGKHKLSTVFMAPIVGVISGIGAHQFLYKFTASGRIERAEQTMRTVRKYTLARESFDTDNELLQEILSLYLFHDWPLVEACNDLASYRDTSLQAINMAQDAQYEDPIYTVRVERVKQVMYGTIENMNRAIKYIKAHRDYSRQMGEYREAQHQQELLKAQRSVTIAQWFKIALRVTDLWVHMNKTLTPSQQTSLQQASSQRITLPQTVVTVAEPSYESESCCVCLENFERANEAGVKRVFLRKCGHDICKNCANQLFFGATRATTCPQCRALVDRIRLQAELKK